MSTPVTVGGTIHFGRTGRGARKVIREGPAPNPVLGRIPRVACLMALTGLPGAFPLLRARCLVPLRI